MLQLDNFLLFCCQFIVLSSICFLRPKRSLAEFQSELDKCGPKTCTVIKCTIGPMEKDESVLFKVRSRLFTQTQVEVSKHKKLTEGSLIGRLLPGRQTSRFLTF